MESRPPRPDMSRIKPPVREKVVTNTTKTIEFPKAVKVTISVKRDDKGNSVLVADPKEITIEEGIQVAWTSPDGKLEIRFNPANKPFIGDSYEAGRGGISYSGSVVRTSSLQSSYTYTALVTTKDGQFLTQSFVVRINRKDPDKKY
jgi:hypothetical protein